MDSELRLHVLGSAPSVPLSPSRFPEDLDRKGRLSCIVLFCHQPGSGPSCRVTLSWDQGAMGVGVRGWPVGWSQPWWPSGPCAPALQEKQIVQKWPWGGWEGSRGISFQSLGPWFLRKHRWESFDVLILFNAVNSGVAISLI